MLLSPVRSGRGPPLFCHGCLKLIATFIGLVCHDSSIPELRNISLMGDASNQPPFQPNRTCTLDDRRQSRS